MMVAVYALGLYVDEKATQKVLASKFPGADGRALANDQKLCDGKHQFLQLSSACYHSPISVLLVCRNCPFTQSHWPLQPS